MGLPHAGQSAVNIQLKTTRQKLVDVHVQFELQGSKVNVCLFRKRFLFTHASQLKFGCT